jgi:hypothetical protein
LRIEFVDAFRTVDEMIRRVDVCSCVHAELYLPNIRRRPYFDLFEQRY